jgi:predicted MPP superfamily phosphohydrolase
MTGCHGAIGGPGWRRKPRAATTMRSAVAGDPPSDASLVFLLGDNFYDDGVRTARDERFVSAFRDVCIDAQSKDQQVIFAVLGNHDYKIHGFSAHGQSTAKSLGHFQTRNYTVGRSPAGGTRLSPSGLHLRSREHDASRRSTASVLEYAQSILPALLRTGDFFCIDSNSYIFDTAQQAWLKQAFKDRSDVRNAKILVQHHPIVSAAYRIESRDDLKMCASAFGIGNFATRCQKPAPNLLRVAMTYWKWAGTPAIGWTRTASTST